MLSTQNVSEGEKIILQIVITTLIEKEDVLYCMIIYFIQNSNSDNFSHFVFNL